MAIHKIQAGKFIAYTGDKGLERFHKAVKDELDRQCAIMDEKEQLENNRMMGGLEYKQLRPEDMHYYKRPTALEMLEMCKDDLTKEEYDELYTKFTPEKMVFYEESGPFPDVKYIMGIDPYEPNTIDVKKPHWNDEDSEDEEE